MKKWLPRTPTYSIDNFTYCVEMNSKGEVEYLAKVLDDPPGINVVSSSSCTFLSSFTFPRKWRMSMMNRLRRKFYRTPKSHKILLSQPWHNNLRNARTCTKMDAYSKGELGRGMDRVYVALKLLQRWLTTATITIRLVLPSEWVG